MTRSDPQAAPRATPACATPAGRRARWAALPLAVVLTLLTSGHAYADPASERGEQVRYGKETVNLTYGAYAARKANFVAVGCLSVSTCRKPSPYQSFDWTTDSCSPPTPASWRNLFDPACQQHDFGYRNFGKGLTLGRTEDTRRWVDDRFRTEMKAICNVKFSDWTQYANLQACFAEADTMYRAVRVASDWSKP